MVWPGWPAHEAQRAIVSNPPCRSLAASGALPPLLHPQAQPLPPTACLPRSKPSALPSHDIRAWSEPSREGTSPFANPRGGVVRLPSRLFHRHTPKSPGKAIREREIVRQAHRHPPQGGPAQGLIPSKYTRAGRAKLLGKRIAAATSRLQDDFK